MGVNTCEVGVVTEPECLGPCEPGTSVNLEGIVWHETEEGKYNLLLSISPVMCYFLSADKGTLFCRIQRGKKRGFHTVWISVEIRTMFLLSLHGGFDTWDGCGVPKSGLRFKCQHRKTGKQGRGLPFPLRGIMGIGKMDRSQVYFLLGVPAGLCVFTWLFLDC